MTQAIDQQGEQEGLKDQAAANVQGAASAAQEKASELREQGSVRLRDQFDQRSNQAGTQVRSLAEALRRSGDELMRDIETFARRRPWMLAGIGMLAGVAAARFMKASSEQRYDSYRATSRQQWPTRPDDGYGQPQESPRSGLTPDSVTTGTGTRGGFGDDALARDPHAGTR